MVNDAVKSGAVVRAGAKTPQMSGQFASGHYYEPTVLEVNPSMEIWREEVAYSAPFILHLLHLHEGNIFFTGFRPRGCGSSI